MKTSKRTTKRNSLIQGYVRDNKAEEEVKTKTKKTEIYVAEIGKTITEFHLVGISPLIINRMAGRNKRDLLLPPGRKSAAQKAQSLKHNPVAEFRESVHRMPPGSKTLLAFPAAGPKRAMASVAVDIPGSSKAQIGRLVRIMADDPSGTLVHVWGIPKLYMPVVRNSDINHTPDVRSVAKLDKWVMRIRILYPHKIINITSLYNLLAAAGDFIGLGDGRQEKGKLSFGLFRVVFNIKNDEEAKAIMATTYKEQEKAMELAEPSDEETRDLLNWYNEEMIKRGKEKDESKE